MKNWMKHLLLWVTIYLGYTYMLSFSGNYQAYLLLNLLTVSLYMIAYYLLRYVQIPLLYDKDKRVAFLISILGSSVMLYAFWRIGITSLDGIKGITSAITYAAFGDFLVKVIRFYSPAMALLVIETQYERGKEQDRIAALEKEKIATELKFLKAQINPHFLFNTLNNLYSYVVNESPKAPDMIMRLSSILDYVLFKSQNKTVSLQEEATIIEDFLELEMIRYGERLKVEYQAAPNMSLPISPLILLSIVENAFKHGASGDIDEPKIKIDIKEKNELIHCEVWNTKSKYQGEINDAYKKGIGLSNIKRQLNLVYPDSHELIIEDGEESFNVLLKIKTKA